MSAQKNSDTGNLLKTFTPYQEVEGEEYMNEQQIEHFTKNPAYLETRIDGRSGSYREPHAGRCN